MSVPHRTSEAAISRPAYDYMLIGRTSLTCLLLFFLYAVNYAADIIINSERPENRNAGYNVFFQDVATIEADGENCYFRNLDDIQIAPDGNIFVLDSNQLLKFTPDGKYVCNFVRYGLGPGEAVNVIRFALNDRELILNDGNQDKVIIIDLNNNQLKREFRLSETGAYLLSFVRGNDYYFWHNGHPDTFGKIKFVDIPVNLVAFSSEGKQLDRKITLNIKHFHFFAGKGRVFSNPQQKILQVYLDKEHFFFSSTNDYKIRLYNLVTNTVLYTFKRKYRRVKVTKETEEFAKTCFFDEVNLNGKLIRTPVLDYLNDINKLLIYKKKLWVFTSTVRGNKVLVDVYSPDGRYLDNFYLSCPKGCSPYNVTKWLKTIDQEGFIYAAQFAPDGNKIIKKLKLTEKRN